MSRIFVSHATTDGAAVANNLVAELENLSQSCWLAPRDVVAGRTYAAQILDAIDNCAGVALMLTPAANASRDVAQEIQIAHARNKTIVPLVIDRTIPTGDLAYFLALRQQVSWTTPRAAASVVLNSLGVQPGAVLAVTPAATAVAAAASSVSGVTGVFEMTVRSIRYRRRRPLAKLRARLSRSAQSRRGPIRTCSPSSNDTPWPRSARSACWANNPRGGYSPKAADRLPRQRPTYWPLLLPNTSTGY